MSDRNIRTELRRLSLLYTYPVSHIMESGADHIADLERQLAEARKDSERLDWMDTGDSYQSILLELGATAYRSKMAVPIGQLRQAIDTAMKGQNDE